MHRLGDAVEQGAPLDFMLGINVLATPIFARGDVLVGSIGVVGSMPFDTDPPPLAMLAALHEAAEGVSACLWFQPLRARFRRPPGRRRRHRHWRA